jgi:hypothetical protein
LIPKSSIARRSTPPSTLCPKFGSHDATSCDQNRRQASIKRAAALRLRTKKPLVICSKFISLDQRRPEFSCFCHNLALVGSLRLSKVGLRDLEKSGVDAPNIPHRKADACEQASEFSAVHVLQHILVQRQISHDPLQFASLALKHALTDRKAQSFTLPVCACATSGHS